LLTFLRKHLDKIQYQIDDLNSQLDTGVALILLLGILENYFIPEYAYHAKPDNTQQKLENCKFLFELIDDAGLPEPNCNPEGRLFLNLRNLHLYVNI
jgi:parvin